MEGKKHNCELMCFIQLWGQRLFRATAVHERYLCIFTVFFRQFCGKHFKYRDIRFFDKHGPDVLFSGGCSVWIFGSPLAKTIQNMWFMVAICSKHKIKEWFWIDLAYTYTHFMENHMPYLSHYYLAPKNVCLSHDQCPILIQIQIWILGQHFSFIQR